MTKYHKKAEMGIGTLIIFIAMILVAAIAAGVLLQTAGSLQNKALLTGERSKIQVSTGLRTLLLWAEDGRDRDLEILCQNMKLAPGSDGIKFEDTLLEIHTKNSSSSKIYGRELSNITNTSWLDTRVDVDNDEVTEKVIVWATGGENLTSIWPGLTESIFENATGNTKIIFNVSNGTSPYYNIVSLNTDLSTAGTTSVEILKFDSYINTSNLGSISSVGSVAVIGKTTKANHITDNVHVIVGDATVGADGAYSVEYLVTGSLYREGYLSRGDVVQLCYAAPREIIEDENIIINIVPKTGSVLKYEGSIPDVITHQRVYIYP